MRSHVLRTSAAALAVTLGLTAGVQAAQFQNVATIDISSYVDQENPDNIGTLGFSVAWNGSRLFVGGYQSRTDGAGTGLAGQVGIAEILDPLGTPSAGTTFNKITVPYMRHITGMAIQGNTLVATVDDASENDDPGLVAYNLNDLSQRWSKMVRGGSGPAIDTQTGNVAWTTFATKPAALQDVTTGADIVTVDTSGLKTASPTINFSDGTSTTTAYVRDLAFAPNGDMWTRANNQVFKATRTGDTTTDTPVQMITLGQGSFINSQNLAYLDGLVDGDLVIFNNKPAVLDGGIISFTESLMAITPDGQTVALDFGDFVAENSLGTYDFSWDAATGTLAVLDGWNSQVYIFQTAIPEPATLSLLALGGLATLRRRRSC